FSEATQKRRSCRLGRKRRRVLLLACETLLPVRTALPVTWQTRLMLRLLGQDWPPMARVASAPRLRPGRGRCDAGGVAGAPPGPGDRIPGSGPMGQVRSEPRIMPFRAGA